MKTFLTYTLLGVLLAGCAGSGREPLETVVDKALAGAERQTLLMAEKYSARAVSYTHLTLPTNSLV